MKAEAERILVSCPNWVGDVVMATPALRCLRRNYPRARITLLMRPYVRQILEGAPWFDDLLLYAPARRFWPFGWAKGIAWFLQTARRLRKERFDLAVLLTHSFRSALLARLSGARRRIGYTRGDQWWLLTDPVPWPREGGRWVPLPKVRAYLMLCERLGCEETNDQRQELFFTPTQEGAARDLIRKSGGDPEKPIFGIVPGASFGSSKFWSVAGFARVADEFIERRGWQAGLFAGPGEEKLALEIARQMKRRALLFEPTELSLAILKPMISFCKLLITTDTGPRHFGVAFGVPTVVIMGPTDPRHTESAYANTIILRHEVPCGPCHLRRCPRGHECMERITPEMVIEAAETLLARQLPGDPLHGKVSAHPPERIGTKTDGARTAEDR